MFLKELRDRKLNKIIRQVDKKNIVSRYFWLLIGCFIVAFAFNVFFLQYNLVCIGITGLSIVLQKYMEPSKLILIINIGLIILSFIILGKEKTKNSIIGAIIIPVLVSLTKPLVPFFNLDGLEPIVIAILGGVLTGFGYGLIFKNGFTGGGTDIINQIVTKYTKVSTGTAIVMIDGLVVLSAKLVYSWETVLYGYIILYIISSLTDKVILGISQSKAFYIVTDKEEEIKEFLLKVNDSGVTYLTAKGGYTNDKHLLLLAVVPTRNYFIVKEGLKKIDNNIFFLVCDAYEVYQKEGIIDE